MGIPGSGNLLKDGVNLPSHGGSSREAIQRKEIQGS